MDKTTHKSVSKSNSKSNVGGLLRRAVSVIWPVECAMCRRPLHRDEDVLCLHCLMDLPRYGATRQLVHTGAPGGFIAVRSWFIYDHDHPSHSLVHDLKYHDCRRLACKLGREFGRELREDFFLDDRPVDIILPIPLHWTKHLRRSYNQAREIALGVGQSLGVPVGDNLYARRAHKTQTARNREERNANVRDLFAVRRPHELDGRHIAILDDVITTGATMFSAVETILSVSHPASLTFLSLANTRLD